MEIYNFEIKLPKLQNGIWEAIYQQFVAVRSKFLCRNSFINGPNFLFHHCTLARNVVLETPEYTSFTNSDKSLGTYIMKHGSGTNLFIHTASYGSGCIIANFII